MHLVDLPTNPRILAGKVYLVAELFAHRRIRAQRVQRRGDDAGLLLLVVEEGEEGDGHGDDEDGKGAEDLFRDEWGNTIERN